MRRIIHTFILAFQFIILPAVFTACKDDGGNISPLQEVTPAFSWEENSFLLETDNGWGITRFSNRIALSNFSQKRQYHLSWNGGSGAGEKTSGVLRIAEAGKKLQTILLDKLLIEDIDGMYYNIHFQKTKNRHIAIIQITMPEQTVIPSNDSRQACDTLSLFF